MYVTDHGINLAEDQDIYRADKRLRAQGYCPFYFLLEFHIAHSLTHDGFPHVTRS